MKKLIFLTSLFLLLSPIFMAQGALPESFLYQGELLDSNQNPRSGTYDFRFSFWTDQDYESTDVQDNGTLDTSKSDYLNWQEHQSVKLMEEGRFSLKIGEINNMPFPFYDLSEVYLQIEVKKISEPDTSYELIDSNPGDDTQDRLIIASVPYAYNAASLQSHEAGFESGNIPYLDENGKLPISTNPGGTESNIFILDSKNDGGDITLRFGESLNKNLFWNQLLNRFVFDDDLEVTGDLMVSGTINGININTLASGSGAYNITKIFYPSYEGSIFQADGNDNRGSMYEAEDPVAGNLLKWSTKETNAQDYDIVVRYRIPDKFASFPEGNQISLNYKTDGKAPDNAIHFTVQKEGDPISDELYGSGLSLSSSSWTETDFALQNTTKWQSGDTMIFRLKMVAREGMDAFLGAIKLRYNSN